MSFINKILGINGHFLFFRIEISSNLFSKYILISKIVKTCMFFKPEKITNGSILYPEAEYHIIIKIFGSLKATNDVGRLFFFINNL